MVNIEKGGPGVGGLFLKRIISDECGYRLNKFFLENRDRFFGAVKSGTASVHI